MAAIFTNLTEKWCMSTSCNDLSGSNGARRGLRHICSSGPFDFFPGYCPGLSCIDNYLGYDSEIW